MQFRRIRAAALTAAVLAVVVTGPSAQTSSSVTTPKQFFGFNIGDDYRLANYSQFSEYFHKLEKETNRMKVVEIGKTSEGRPHLMAIVSSPENMKKLDRYREISAQLAHAEGLTDDQARALAKEGKSIVWIDGGLHATEVLGAAQLTETIYQLVSRTDPETMRFLNDDIILFMHANPDGMELVSNWYMRHPEPQQRTIGAGAAALSTNTPATTTTATSTCRTWRRATNLLKVMYREWFPQIVYNHHQTGPGRHGDVRAAVPRSVQLQLRPAGAGRASSSSARRCTRASSRRTSPGVTDAQGLVILDVVQRRPAHGVLLPQHDRPADRDDRQPDADGNSVHSVDSSFRASNLLDPIEPQPWHFRQSIEYSMTANRAVLDIASTRAREPAVQFLQDGQERNRSWQPRHLDEPRRTEVQAATRRIGAAAARGDED